MHGAAYWYDKVIYKQITSNIVTLGLIQGIIAMFLFSLRPAPYIISF